MILANGIIFLSFLSLILYQLSQHERTIVQFLVHVSPRLVVLSLLSFVEITEFTYKVY